MNKIRKILSLILILSFIFIEAGISKADSVEMGEVKLIKNDDNFKVDFGEEQTEVFRLADVKFELRKLEDDSLVDTYTTDDAGEINLELGFGKYYFKEINMPSFMKPDNEKYIFEINSNNLEKKL